MLYDDVNSNLTTKTVDPSTNSAVFTVSITEAHRWVKCGMYVAESGLFLYSTPARVYYRGIVINTSLSLVP